MEGVYTAVASQLALKFCAKSYNITRHLMVDVQPLVGRKHHTALSHLVPNAHTTSALHVCKH
eukprot:7130488-Ditylum_brightwellii.AAC.1